MQVKDTKSGQVIETLGFDGIPTGNVYKIANSVCDATGRKEAWKAYRQGKVKLHIGVKCRVLAEPGQRLLSPDECTF